MRNELLIQDGIVTRGNRMVIPKMLKAEIIACIHDGHQGLNKCRERANTSVWWPVISTQIKLKVLSCLAAEFLIICRGLMEQAWRPRSSVWQF